MCKISCLTGEISSDLARRFSEESANLFAGTQRDGFGAMFVGRKTVLVERVLNPSFYHAGSRVPVAWSGDRNSEGATPTIIRSVVCHGRASTNRVSMANVHPFVKQTAEGSKLYMVHNGILQWTGNGKRPKSTDGCDSDEFASWLASGVDVRAASDYWSGYGAIFVVGPYGNDLRLIKDSIATLHAVQRIGRGWVFSTSSADCARLARICGVKRPKPFAVPAGIVTFAKSGEIESVSDFGGFGLRSNQYCPGVFVKPAKEESMFPDWEPNGKDFVSKVSSAVSDKEAIEMDEDGQTWATKLTYGR